MAWDTFNSERVSKQGNSSSDILAPNESGSVKCKDCHHTAKEFIVKKDGPNKGRAFYACSKQKSCKFFQWADDTLKNGQKESHSIPYQSSEQSTNSRNINFMAPQTNTVPIPTAEVKCHCRIVASCLTVQKDGPNKGRLFYSCSNIVNSCGFFQWCNESGTQGFTSSGICRNNTQSWDSRRNMSRERMQEPTENKKRKCGLCRQEGHTRQKCPRKAEFIVQ